MKFTPYPKVFLGKRKAGAAIGRHPWVFAGAIGRIEGEHRDGEAVVVHNGEDGSFIAYGLWNSRSDIRIRLYSWDAASRIDEALFRSRIGAAVDLRNQLYGPPDPLSARRIVYGESDGISGLIADQYGPYLVVKITSRALARRLEMLVRILREIVHPKGVFLRADTSEARKEGLDVKDAVLFGEIPETPVLVKEGGIKLEVFLREGQKTGLYLDQRENHRAVAPFARGRNVLDLYCYTGGFSLHCARAGAAKTVGIDSSAWAIRQAGKNAELNSLATCGFVEMEALEFLKVHSAHRYSLVILDPPRMAGGREFKENALRAYHRLNIEALRLLEPKGILVSCSCSGRVSMQEFVGLLASVARRSRRTLQVLELRGAARDHFFTTACPEAQYLKCVVARVL